MTCKQNASFMEGMILFQYLSTRYSIIDSCWHVKSDERPTFSELVMSLESLQFTQTEIEVDKHPYFVLEV